MLHIILMILKIIGIILLVIIGLLLLALAAVLFIPVRYRIEAEYDGKPTAKVRVTWLLHLVRVYVSFDQKLVIRVKAAMFTIYGKKAKKRKVDREIHKENKAFDEKVKDVFEEEEEKVAEKNLDHFDQNKDTYALTDEEPDRPDADADADADPDPGPGSKVQTEEQQTLVHGSDQVNHADKTNDIDQTGDQDPMCAPIRHKKRPGFFRWLKHRILFLYHRICNIIKKIREYIKSVIKKLIATKNSIFLKIQTVIEMIEDEENRALVAFLWEQLKALIRLIRPRKYKIDLHYGFEDPYTTGQVSMYLAVAYGLLGIRMNVEPDFEQEVLEGKVFLKGQIRVFPVLWILLKVYMNKLFRKIILKRNKK